MAFPSCGCHSPVRDIMSKQLGVDVGAWTQAFRFVPFAQMERDLPALLWLSEQLEVWRTWTPLPAPGAAGWARTGCRQLPPQQPPEL